MADRAIHGGQTMKTYYSPQRWLLVGAFLAGPSLFLIPNFIDHGLGWPWVVMYAAILVGAIYAGYRYSLAHHVPTLSVSATHLRHRAGRQELYTTHANLQRLTRLKNGQWRLTFHEPIWVPSGAELTAYTVSGFSRWRREQWRAVLGQTLIIDTEAPEPLTRSAA